jgi:hypothetical protein
VQNAIRAAGREQLESLTGRLRRLCQDAAETRGAAMQAEDASWSPRIKAADSVIGRPFEGERVAEFGGAGDCARAGLQEGATVSIRRRLQALERRIEGPVIICLVWPEVDEEGQKWRVAPD